MRHKLSPKLGLRGFAAIIPKRVHHAFARQLAFSGHEATADKYLGSAVALSLLAAAAAAILLLLLGGPGLLAPAAAAAAFLAAMTTAYFILLINAERRNSQLEEVLPHALLLIASNIKAGMTPFEAIQRAASQELGPLAAEIRRATAKGFGSGSFTGALLGVSERFRSEELERVLRLINTSMRSGGRLATLLEELSQDIQETRALRRDLAATTKATMAFILFSVVIGTPLLMAVSLRFLTTLTTLQAAAAKPAIDFGLMASEISITPDFLGKAALAMIVLNALLASVLQGVIARGALTWGLRNAPFVIAASLAAFALSRSALSILA